MPEELEQRLQSEVIGKPMHRNIQFTREAVNVEARTVSIAVSSESPVERWFGYEILSHDTASIRMGRILNGAPLLDMHDTDDQIGVVESCTIDADRVMRAVVRFSKSPDAEIIFQDIVDGIRSKISVGYMVHKMILDRKEGEQSYYRATDWEPYEVSVVSVAADDFVGVGREHPITTQANQPKEVRMPEEPKPAPAPDPQVIEAQRREQIVALKAKYTGRVANIDVLADEALSLGVEVAAFRGLIYSRISDSLPLDPDARLGMEKRDVKRYSMTRAIIASLQDKGDMDMNITDVRGNKIDTGYEREISKAWKVKDPEHAGKRGGISIPEDVLAASPDVSPEVLEAARMLSRQYMKRDLSVGTDSAGGYLRATNLMSFVELLRNATLALSVLGVREMTGLVGNVAMPKQTGATAGGWQSTEGTAPSEGNATFGQVTLSPKDYNAYTDMTRRLLLQSTPSVDLVIMEDLARVHGVAHDLAIFHGSGASGQPQGLVGTSGIGSVTGTSLTWAGALEFLTDVAGANGLIGPAAFITTPTVWATLAGREKATNTAKFINELGKFQNVGNVPVGEIAGFPTYMSAQITSANILFGVWSQILLGRWGGIDILADPYTGSAAGTLRLASYSTVDVAVRQAGSFSVSTNFS